MQKRLVPRLIYVCNLYVSFLCSVCLQMHMMLAYAVLQHFLCVLIFFQFITAYCSFVAVFHTEGSGALGFHTPTQLSFPSQALLRDSTVLYFALLSHPKGLMLQVLYLHVLVCKNDDSLGNTAYMYVYTYIVCTCKCSICPAYLHCILHLTSGCLQSKYPLVVRA